VSAEPPAIRASDAEREQVAARLRTAGEEGRLDVSELEERLERAYAARTHEELDALTADLPRRTPGTAVDRGGIPLSKRIAGFVPVTVILVVIWAATGAGYFWPIWPMLFFAMTIFGPQHGHHRHRHRRRPSR
jgi:hypothetical protein